MGELVVEYIKTKKLLMDSFECNEDYFIKDLQSFNWTISTTDNWCIVSYWEDGKDFKIAKTDVAVVKKNGKLQIFKTDKYTMIIGIQCVKIAFLFDNKKRIC